MDQERFERLKQEAIRVSGILDTLTGDISFIRRRNRVSTRIDLQLLLLEKRGKPGYSNFPICARSTLDDLRECLDDADTFIEGENQWTKKGLSF